MIASGLSERRNRHYRDSLQQHWRHNDNVYYDQFQFRIYKEEERKYVIRWKDRKVGQTYSLAAAKLIANILLNDYIENKP